MQNIRNFINIVHKLENVSISLIATILFYNLLESKNPDKKSFVTKITLSAFLCKTLNDQKQLLNN